MQYKIFFPSRASFTEGNEKRGHQIQFPTKFLPPGAHGA